MHKLASWWTFLFPWLSWRENWWATWKRTGYSQYRGHYCFWHLTVWLFIPLLLFHRCNKFDPYLHSIVFTDKIQTKEEEQANAESAWGEHGNLCTNLNYVLIFGCWKEVLNPRLVVEYWNIQTPKHAKSWRQYYTDHPKNNKIVLFCPTGET